MTRPRVSRGRLWLALTGLVAGLLAGWSLGVPSLVWILGAVGTATALLLRRSTAIWILLPAVTAGLMMSAGRAARDSALREMSASAADCRLRGQVTEVSGLGTFGRIVEARCDGFTAIQRPGTAAIVDDNLKPGDIFSAQGRLEALSDDPYDVARSRLGIDAVFYPDEIATRSPTGPAVVPFAYRDSMSDVTSPLEWRSGALLLGLAIGDTSRFDNDTLETFRRSGLAHLLAVSGSNVAIVIGAVALCLGRVSARKRLALCAIALAFYVLVVGPDPSVVRAAAMGAIGLAGIAWGSRPETLAALGLALTATLALRPALLFSVGLHLSAAATAGLVLWSRPFATLLGYRLPRWIAWPLGATLAAQVAVLPFLALAFGEVSLTAPLANLAALPAVAPATVLGLAAAGTGLFNETVGTGLAILASPLARWIVLCAEFFGRPGWAQASVPTSVGWASLAVVGVFAVNSARSSSGVH